MNPVILSQPTLVLLMGVVASVKSTLSKKVLQRLNVTYIDNNFISDAFFPSTRNDPEYMKLRPHFYEILYRITEENLLIGNSVLLDAPHIKEMRDAQWQTTISDMVTKLKTKLVIIRCLCSEQTLKKRVTSRGEERDKWKIINCQDFLKEQPMDVYIPFDHIDINTDNDLIENVESVIKYILYRKTA